MKKKNYIDFIEWLKVGCCGRCDKCCFADDCADFNEILDKIKIRYFKS